MNYAEALEHRASMKREPKSKMMSMEMKKADNGGVVVMHRMSGPMPAGGDPTHAFGADEGHMLAKHITEHLGMKMPGIKESETHGAQSEEPMKEASED